MHDIQSARRVVKLGGSLLDHDNVAGALRRWLAAQSPAQDLLIVGGGELADVVRRADQRHGLGEAAAHWLCVRAMGVNARRVAALLPEADYVTSLDELNGAEQRTDLAIIDPWQFLNVEDPRRSTTPLPESWDVTSDSIAARLTALCGAAELVLLKSALPNSVTSLQAAADEGYVDRYFPIAATGIARVRCVDLRAESFPQATLASSIPELKAVLG